MPPKANPRGFHRPARRFPGHDGPVNRMAWSPTGYLLATPSMDKTIKIWDIRQPGKAIMTLVKHRDRVNSVTWSPDGQLLASGSADNQIMIWNPAVEEPVRPPLQTHSIVYDVAWSPDGAALASAHRDGSVVIWDTVNFQAVQVLRGHYGGAYALAWTPDGHYLFVGSADRTVVAWNWQDNQRDLVYEHSGAVYDVCLSPDTTMLASASEDNTIQISKVYDGELTVTLEGHTGAITSVAFSPDSQFLVSRSLDGTSRIWRLETLDAIAILEQSVAPYASVGLAFHNTQPLVATLTDADQIVHVWKYDPQDLSAADAMERTIRYTNAKVIVLGAQGVGKTKLSTVLRGKSFNQEPDNVAAGRRIWWLHRENRLLEDHDDTQVLREIMLWDTAGEPAFRFLNQLHLNDVTLALMLFDTQAETDPFEGIRYWHRALRHAQQLENEFQAQPPMRFLVGTKADNGVTQVPQEAIVHIYRDLNYDRYYETSASENRGIEELNKAIRTRINWDSLPQVSSTALFHRIKNFLIDIREQGNILHTLEALYQHYVDFEEGGYDSAELFEEFDTCTRLLAAQGLLKRLGFGDDLVLLQPEIMDEYAFALLRTAHSDLEQRGIIREQQIMNGEFHMPADRRLRDAYQEKQLLVAAMQDLNRYDIAMQDQDPETGEPILVFPSQVTRAYQDALPAPDRETTMWEFEGSTQTIFSTLIAQLWRAEVFKLHNLYRYVAFFNTHSGGSYCLVLKPLGPGRARLIRFGGDDHVATTGLMLDTYIHEHLETYALRGSLSRLKHTVKRQSAVRSWVGQRQVSTMKETIAERHREESTRYIRAGNQQVIAKKKEQKDHDVFISYNSREFDEVLQIAEGLIEAGIYPWLDKWELAGGQDWMLAVENQIKRMVKMEKPFAYFVGGHGEGNEHREEFAYAHQFQMRIIPVVLTNAPADLVLPFGVTRQHRIDFREPSPDPLQEFIRSIRRTGMLPTAATDFIYRDRRHQ